MNSPKKQTYWFKQQYHVWQPTSWQGYTTVAVFLVVTIGNIGAVILNPYSNQLLWLYLNILFISVVSLLIAGSLKGPAPK